MTKKILKISACVIAAVLIIGLIFGVYALAVTFATTSITLDTSKRYQTMQGFGASSAWIYQQFGLEEDVNLKNTAMEMLYGKSGLALNTFRYNVGAGGVDVDPQFNERSAESFFVADNFDGDYTVFADENNYDFTSRDQAVLNMFEAALATRNIERVIFFANSPHYLMTKNGKTHGEKVYDNNLKENCYEAFSQYMLVIVNYLYKNYVCKYDSNIEILISPVNEPQWKWGGEGATQEGCHFDPKPLAKFYDTFYNTLKEFNKSHNTNFEMDIFESGNYKMILSSHTNFNEYMTEFEKYEFFEDVKTISLHSYGADESVFYRENFADYMAKYYPNISISMSEYCTLKWGVDESIDMGMSCGKVIMRDLTILNATDWQWWLSIARGGYEDGLVYWLQDNDGISSLDVTKRYYVMGHFSKYIYRGSVRISSNYSDFLGLNGVECAAFKNPDDSITVVVLNDSSKSHKIDLKGIEGYNRVKEVLTDSDVDWQVREYDFAGNVKVPANSITTFVLTRK
ncbi:MAG: hypothetical protein K2M75_07950 [Clostridia bacterium]|nr:hypothetical protein [Clostridia bacterium]